MENYILTRYLYSFVEAKQSLVLCILKQDFEGALYWGYELYFSGFDEEIFDFCCEMTEEFYRKKVSMKKQIMIEKSKWIKNTDNDILLGNCIAILCNNAPNIASFIKSYFGVNCKKDEQNTMDEVDNKYSMNEELLVPLLTFQDHSLFPYKVLKKVQTRSPVRHYRDLFRTIIPENDNEIRSEKWLYYASRSPLWYERIIRFKGIIDEENKTVSFDNDNFDEFYNHWGYEPDEQSKEIQYNMGLCCNTEQKDLTAFCNEFHCRIPKIRKKRATK